MQRLRPAILAISTGLRYGLTQALVLRSSYIGNTKESSVVTADEKSNHSASLVDYDKIAELLAVDDYTVKVPATCQPAHKALRPYLKYPKLFGERKYARNYSHTTTPFTKTFTDLPGEIRNRIYRFFLVITPEIDLCPKTTIHEKRTEYNIEGYALQRCK